MKKVKWEKELKLLLWRNHIENPKIVKDIKQFIKKLLDDN